MYRDVARERSLRLIDHHLNWEQLLEKNKILFDQHVPDGLHPGAEGCAKAITPAILRALGLRAEQPAEGGVTFPGGKQAPKPVATTYIKCHAGNEKNSVVSTRFKLAELDQQLGEKVKHP